MKSGVPHALALATSLALALAIVTTASAQVPVNPQPAVSVAIGDGPARVPAGNSTTFTATVTNDGSVGGAVTIAPNLPEGWTAEVEPSQFPLAAGASQPVTVTVTAPAAGQGAETGSIGVGATLTDQAGRTATGEASLAVTRVDPAPPPPPPPGPNWLLIGALVALVLAGAAGVVLWRVRAKRAAAAHAAYIARETGIAIRAAGGPFPLGLKRETTWKVEVENTSDRPRVAVVGIADRPETWVASVSTPRVPLNPGEKAVVTVFCRPNANVPIGERAAIIVTARPAEAQERDERVTLDVVAEEPRIPAAGTEPPAVQLRPGAPRPLLRR